MNAEKVAEVAMEATYHYRAMRNNRNDLVEVARKNGSDQVESLEAESAEYEKYYRGALSVLAEVLEALGGYDVRKPYRDGSGSAPSPLKAEAELEKWRAQKRKQKAKASA